MGIAFRARQFGVDAKYYLTSLHRPRTIRQRLAMLVLAAVVPLNVLVVVAMTNIAAASRQAQVDGLLYTTQTVVVALDAYLKHYIALAEVLAKAPSLLNNDLTTFRTEAERAFPDASEAALIVSDLQGQQLLNLLVLPGAPLPRRPDTGLATQARAFSTKSSVISDVVLGKVRGDWVADIEVPVFRKDQPFRSLTVTLTAKGIYRLLSAQKIPSGWLAGIIDRTGRFLARIPANDTYVGQLASASWREIMHREGVFEFRTLEGDKTVGANLISKISGWPVAVSAQVRVLNAPFWDTTKWATAGTIIISLVSVLLAFAIARRISTPIIELEKQASALLAGQSAHLNSELPEIDHAWAALNEAVAERKKAEAHQQLLQHELAHRSKNLIALVQALAKQMARSNTDPAQFADELGIRLRGLAVAQELLTSSQLKGADFRKLVLYQLATFLPKSAEDRLTLDGPFVLLPADMVTSVSMVLHELATNASKHGALSVPSGNIHLTWTLSGKVEKQVLHLTWSETGGPPASPPAKKGFGSTLLTTSAARFEPRYLPKGFECEIDFEFTP